MLQQDLASAIRRCGQVFVACMLPQDMPKLVYSTYRWAQKPGYGYLAGDKGQAMQSDAAGRGLLQTVDDAFSLTGAMWWGGYGYLAEG